ncbi:hypothetical protein HLB15_23435, partial [Promicromonospora citrea]|nr:hypothetical protein [Promicromonospora citrea]
MAALSGLTLLARRQLRTSWGATAALGVVAFLAAGVLSTAPRAVEAMHAAQVVHETATASGLTRDVVAIAGAVPGEPPSGRFYDLDQAPGGAGGVVPEVPDWTPLVANLDAVRAETPEPLRSTMGAPLFHVTSGDFAYTDPVPGSELSEAKVYLRAATDLDEHAELVEGRWPEPTAGPVPAQDGGSFGRPARPAPPFEVAVSRAVAETYGWEVGGRYDTLSGAGVIALGERYPSLVVTGVFETGDPDADYWLHHALAAQASVVADPNRGLLGSAAVYVSPAMIAPLTLGMAETRVWYPVDTTGVTAAAVPQLLAQLSGQSASTYTVPAGPDDPVPLQLRPASRLDEILSRLLAQRTGVDAIVAVLAVGPLGATLAVLALGVGAFLAFGGTLVSTFSIPGTETDRVAAQLAEEVPGASGATGTVVLRTEDGQPFTAEQEAAVATALDDVAGLDGVASTVDPFATQDQIEQQRQQLADGADQLEAGRAELESGQEQLDAAAAQLQAAGVPLSAAPDLEAQQSQLDAGRAELEAQAQQLELGQELADLSSGIRTVSQDGTSALAVVQFTQDQFSLPEAVRTGVVDRLEQADLPGVQV